MNPEVNQTVSRPDLRPEGWSEFRPTPDGQLRDFEEISSVELRNAAQQIQDHTTEKLNADELQRAVLAVFGFQRKTKRFLKRLEDAVEGL